MAENGIGAFRFASAVNSRGERGVGDVADEGFAGAHPDNDIRRTTSSVYQSLIAANQSCSVLSCRKKRRSLRKTARIGTAIQHTGEFASELLGV